VFFEWQETGHNCIQNYSAAPDIGGLSIVTLKEKLEKYFKPLRKGPIRVLHRSVTRKLSSTKFLQPKNLLLRWNEIFPIRLKGFLWIL
jgi:hypothetical protein